MNTVRRLSNNKVLTQISNQCRRLLSSEVEGAASVGERPRVEKCVNKVTLLGRVGKEGEVRGTTENPCLIFPLATSFTYRKASTGLYLFKTDWHRICIFQPGLRHIASSIRKGDRVMVEGSLSHQRFTDETNRPVNITSIIAEEIVFLSRRQQKADEDEESS